jgi:ABC-type uncharacterized transport system permease subunit
MHPELGPMHCLVMRQKMTKTAARNRILLSMSLTVRMVEMAVAEGATLVVGTVIVMVVMAAVVVVEPVVVEVAAVAQAVVQVANTQEVIQFVMGCLGKRLLEQMSRDIHIIAPSHRSESTTHRLVQFKPQIMSATLFRPPK